MLDNVPGNVGAHILVGATASSLCVLLIMGLKLKWFRARMTFDQPTAQQETPYVGVYRSKFASDFDSPSPSSFNSSPSALAPVPNLGRMPTSNQLPQSSRKPHTVQTNSKEGKSKKTKEEKLKVPKVKDVNTKLPNAAKAKAPKVPREVKPEVQKPSGTMPKEAKTKPSRPTSKVKAPKSPDEVPAYISKNKDKETKGQKNKTKVKDIATEKQLSNGVVKNGNNIFTQDKEEITSTTNNTFLFIRPKSEALPKPHVKDDGSAMLRYDQDLSNRGQNHAMRTFSSMMPTKGQVDLSVSPIPQQQRTGGNLGALRNPIASGVESYKSPRVGGDKATSGSVYIDMNVPYTKANKQFIMNLEDESES